MRHIYFICHNQPDFPDRKEMCSAWIYPELIQPLQKTGMTSDIDPTST